MNTGTLIFNEVVSRCVLHLYDGDLSRVPLALGLIHSDGRVSTSDYLVEQSFGSQEPCWCPFAYSPLVERHKKGIITQHF